MNFLAHAYLAGNDPGLIAGNLLADSVNKSLYLHLPQNVRAGIEHHRMIDNFTDTHPIVRSCRKTFFPYIRHFAAVIIDIIFDHFLAKHWSSYHSRSLAEFEQYIFDVVDQYSSYFPDKFAFIYTRMKAHRWLYNYQFTNYIYQTIDNLSYRSPNFHHAQITVQLFLQNYSLLEEAFKLFFQELCIKFKKNQTKICS